MHLVIALVVVSTVMGIAVVVAARLRIRNRTLHAMLEATQERNDELEITYSQALGRIGELQAQQLPPKWRGVIRELVIVAVHIAQDERTSDRALRAIDPEAAPDDYDPESNYRWRLTQIATAARVDVDDVLAWVTEDDRENGEQIPPDDARGASDGETS